MRQYLLAAAAVAPLLLLAGGAAAQTTIDDERTTPITTSGVSGGNPGDVTITAEGSVNVNAEVAVTVDSDNNFINQGQILMEEAPDGGIGVLILTPRNADFTNGGNISVLEDYEAEDTNDDGVPDGPWAQGSGRYGVRVMGTGPWTGDFTNSGAINVEGNDSFGVSIESAMAGNIAHSGSITVIGDNTIGLRETAGVDGEVRLSGAVTASGKGAVGVDLEGDVTGALRIYSAIQSSGYRLTQRPNNPEVLENLLPENMLQGGSALRVRGDVLGGIFIGAPPPSGVGAPDQDDDDDGTTNDKDTDDDGDGIPDDEEDNDNDGVPDVEEGAGAVQVFGSAPAVLIGQAGEDVRIGKFGTDENGYGLIVRGGVAASGVFDEVSATGIQIGTGDGTVTIDGGVRVVGTLGATAYQADAMGLRVLSGANANSLIVEGTIAAAAAAITAEGTNDAYGVLVEQGGSLTSLTNSGRVTATLTGENGSAYAVVDRSGTLSQITNTQFIGAITRPLEAGGATNGERVALDLRANTSGVTLVQNPNPDSTEDAPITPAISGDILMGSGADTVRLNAGTVFGALDYGAGGGSLSIDGGASYAGALRSADAIGINIGNGTLIQRDPGTVRATSLDIGSKGTLVFSADPANGRASRFEVAGTTNIADGGKIGLSVLSLPKESQSFVVLDADSINAAGGVDSLLESSPFIVVSSAEVDQAAGDITINLRRRTAEEAGFAKFEADAYDAVYEAVSLDEDILGVVLGQTDREGLIGAVDQLLPDHAGGVVRGLSWAQEAAARAAADWPRGEMTGPTRAWTQEIGLGESKDRREAAAWRIYGFGIAGGLENVSANGSALGVMVNFTANNVKNPDTAGDDIVGASQLGIGAYWRGNYGGFRPDAQVGAGYVWVRSRREFIATVDDVPVLRRAEADWSGYSLSGRLGLAYEAVLGDFVLVPMTHLDYYRLSENGFEESGGGDGFDLIVESRTSDVLSWTSSVLFGYRFGSRTVVRPEIELGWRQVLSGSGGRTRGRFSGGTIPFELFGENIEGGAPVARIGVRVSNSYLDLKLDAGGEFRDEYTDLDLRLTVRIVF
ncbi:MAG TPA: autotransporter domain-containing protein [Caulobacteraceae bacterium]|jgi:hypothetical protein